MKAIYYGFKQTSAQGRVDSNQLQTGKKSLTIIYNLDYFYSFLLWGVKFDVSRLTPLVHHMPAVAREE